ncbi:MAG: homogentisate 1,2-dioxygenase [Novosphingobium sp.]|nr:homogentisate 1,2-dioxygenase [Novosphingobium sp.]
MLTPSGGALAQEITGMGAASSAMPMTCPATPAALPGELSGWNRRVPLVAAQEARAAARLTPGTAVDGTLGPTPEVHYALRPEKPGGSVSFGGIYAFTVPAAGQYRVALGSAAWIDVIKASDTTRGLTSIAHGHGPDCSGIRKMVDFALEPGDYLLQISANADAKLPLLVTRLP